MTIYEISYSENWNEVGEKGKGWWHHNNSKNILGRDADIAVSRLKKRLVGSTHKSEDRQRTFELKKLRIMEVKALATTD
jgi:hypothetical protein